MSVKDLSKFKINNSHTLQEYLFNYGHLYYKGKLLKFDISETWAMDPKRRYWEIKDKDGVVRYFEVPFGYKYVHLTRPTYVKHRTAKRWAFGIIFGAVLASCTSFTIGKYVFLNNNIKKPPIYDLTDFKQIYIAYQDWKEKGGGDPLNEFGIAEMANIAMANSLFMGNSKTPNDRPLLTVGYGHSCTDALLFDVNVDISNCFIKQQDGDCLEESISYGSQVVAPKVSKRDRFYINDLKVDSYDGTASSSKTSKWNQTITSTYTKDEYSNAAGKDPSNPLLYTINGESTLTDKVYDEDPITQEKHYGNSYVKRLSNNQYDFHIDLHNVKGVGRYMKRIHYLSNKSVKYFNYVTLDFHADEELKILSFTVKELYSVTSLGLRSEGTMRTKYYYDDVPDIPNVNKGENFDYSKYNF